MSHEALYMNKPALIGCLVLLMGLTSCGGVNQSEKLDKTGNEQLIQQQQQRHQPKSQVSAAFKTWYSQLSTTPQQGGVSKANIWIKADLAWLSQLGLGGDNNVVVNAANESIAPGGGIDGALHKSVSKIIQPKTIKGWGKVLLPTGGTAKKLQAGEYALSNDVYQTTIGNSTIGFSIYHACGPRANRTTNLQDAQDKVKILYYNMLCKSHAAGKTCIVLPAISTAIFAGPGPGFTKEQFIVAMYEGMYQGIQQFLTAHSRTTLCIILNNWKPCGV